mgnify:CR=1 FL=1
MMALEEVIIDNFLVIFYSIVVIVILAIIAKIINTREQTKADREIADINLKRKKLETYEKEQHLDKLKEVAVVLKDSEKKKLDEISRDKAVLSRRSIYLMNEIEERMQRLERGVDNAKLIQTLNDVKEAEDDLFGKKQGDRK